MSREEVAAGVKTRIEGATKSESHFATCHMYASTPAR